MAIDGKSIKSTSVGGNSSYQNFVSLVSVTLPQALRSMANQLENVSELLFGLSHQDKPVESCARSPANNPTPLVCSFDN
jgi:hypothetical protein